MNILCSLFKINRRMVKTSFLFCSHLCFILTWIYSQMINTLFFFIKSQRILQLISQLITFLWMKCKATENWFSVKRDRARQIKGCACSYFIDQFYCYLARQLFFCHFQKFVIDIFMKSEISWGCWRKKEEMKHEAVTEPEIQKYLDLKWI